MENDNIEKVNIKLICNDLEFVPKYASEGAAGFDIKAYIEEGTQIRIFPNETVLVPTGLKVAVPNGYEIQIRPRSGMSLKGITVANSPGTIDSDYRGEIKVIIHNGRNEMFVINRGDRIAQGVVQKVPIAEFILVATLDETERGSGGFGSTGVK